MRLSVLRFGLSLVRAWARCPTLFIFLFSKKKKSKEKKRISDFFFLKIEEDFRLKIYFINYHLEIDRNLILLKK